MRELSLAGSIVGTVGERADGRLVRRVTVRIGALTGCGPPPHLRS
jgi:Zn finger protein HypA/HybF involved in hydrogenase expression